MIRYLQDMVDFLQENPVILLNDNDDGRINSATNLLGKAPEIKKYLNA